MAQESTDELVARFQALSSDEQAALRQQAKAHLTAAGVAPWCDLREGEMEAIPLPDESVDVVISNGVPGSPSSTNRPLRVPTSSSVIGR